MLPQPPQPPNPLQGIQNFFGNLFKPPAAPKPSAPLIMSPQQAQNMQGLSSNYYQVKPDDTFQTIAQNTGVPEEKLQDYNKMIVPPPKGTYINLNPPANRMEQGQAPVGISGSFLSATGVPNTQTAAQYPVSPTSNFAQERGWDTSTAAAPLPQPSTGANSFTSGGNVNLTELSSNITTQLQNGQLPSSIPFQVASQLVNPQTGRPFTQADYQAAGYTYNNQTQQWTIGGQQPASQIPAGQVQTSVGTGEAGFMNTGFMQANAAAGTQFLDQLRWDPQRKKYVKIGQLLREGKLNIRDQQGNFRQQKRREREPEYVAPQEATNAGGTPTQQLSQTMGSG